MGTLPDRVVGRQCRVTERRGERGIQIADRNEVARGWDEHVLGQTAVVADAASEPAELVDRRAAAILRPASALPAAATPPPRVDDHLIAFAHRVGARPERCDRARGLVPEREGQLQCNRSLWPLHHVQIAVAEA